MRAVQTDRDSLFASAIKLPLCQTVGMYLARAAAGGDKWFARPGSIETNVADVLVYGAVRYLDLSITSM